MVCDSSRSVRRLTSENAKILFGMALESSRSSTICVYLYAITFPRKLSEELFREEFTTEPLLDRRYRDHCIVPLDMFKINLRFYSRSNVY